MSRILSRAEAYEVAKVALSVVDFTAFDFDTVKRVLLNHIKERFPENFNDYIESSELIAVIEAFAYVAELLAYRIDVSASENFIATAQRKDSILRLAKLLSYTAARATAARGLVKITSVSTSEPVLDASGVNLAGQRIVWNDASNPAWRAQFFQIMNRALDQPIGSAANTDRFQIQDVVFELYGFNRNATSGTQVMSYTARSGNVTVPMELVPMTYDKTDGIVERRPSTDPSFSFAYAQDGRGDASDFTGFLCFTKQGTLQRIRTTFTGNTPNSIYDVPVDNVNDTDVWVNQIDIGTGGILAPTPLTPSGGLWESTSPTLFENISFSTADTANLYEIETRSDNRVRLLFGDGVTANVPRGTFDIWVRSSIDEDIAVSRGTVANVPATFTYTDDLGRVQTFTFTVSLVGSLLNGAASETIESIRQNAPRVYFTQNRMITGQDYNAYPLSDPSILKLRTINRTFSGDSRYVRWHDPSGTYEDTRTYGLDGVLYFRDQTTALNVAAANPTAVVTGTLSDLLQLTGVINITAELQPSSSYRWVFFPSEVDAIATAIDALIATETLPIYYDTNTEQWTLVQPVVEPTGPVFVVEKGTTLNEYVVTYSSRTFAFHSPSTSFWNANADPTLNLGNLASVPDRVVVLDSTRSQDRQALIPGDIAIVAYAVFPSARPALAGLPDIRTLAVQPPDTDDDAIPNNEVLTDLVGNTTYAFPGLDAANVHIDISGDTIWTLPFLVLSEDVSLVNADPTTRLVKLTGDDIVNPEIVVTNLVRIPVGDTTVGLAVQMNEYVYFLTTTSDVEPTYVVPTVESLTAYLANPGPWLRYIGRNNIKFLWQHETPFLSLVDPAPTNIHDMFIITRAYFSEYTRWLAGNRTTAPTPPTPLDLRTAYGTLLSNKSLSDDVILHAGSFKLLFGSRAAPTLRAKFRIIRDTSTTLTDNQIKSKVVEIVQSFFHPNNWEFGQTVYASEIAAAIHLGLQTDIESVVLVPLDATKTFGDLFQISMREDEVPYVDLSPSDVEVVSTLDDTTLHITSR